MPNFIFRYHANNFAATKTILAEYLTKTISGIAGKTELIFFFFLRKYQRCYNLPLLLLAPVSPTEKILVNSPTVLAT